MPTTASGIVTPSSADNVDVSTDLQTMADSIETIVAGLLAKFADGSGIPFATAAGAVSVNVATANTTGSASVTFPVGRFTVAPLVVTMAQVAAPGSPSAGTAVSGTSAFSVTTAGCTVYMTRNAIGANSVTWIAIQQTSTTAAG